MLKKLKVTSHAFIFCLFGFTLMTVFLFSPNVYAQASGTDIQNDAQDGMINHHIGDKLSEFEKDVSTEFTKLTEDGIQKTNQINDLAQNIRNIFRDGRTRSEEIDALQERIKMLEDRLAKKMRNTQNPDQMPMNTINSNSGYNEHGYPEEHQYDQSTNEKTQGFSSGNAYKEDTKSDCDTPDGRGKNGVIGVDC